MFNDKSYVNILSRKTGLSRNFFYEIIEIIEMLMVCSHKGNHEYEREHLYLDNGGKPGDGTGKYTRLELYETLGR